MKLEELKKRNPKRLSPLRGVTAKSKKWLMGYASGVDDGSLGLTNIKFYKLGKKFLQEKVYYG